MSGTSFVDLEYVEGCMLRLTHSKSVNSIRETAEKTRGEFNKLSKIQKIYVIIAFVITIIVFLMFFWSFVDLPLRQKVVIFYTWTMVLVFAAIVYFIY